MQLIITSSGKTLGSATNTDSNGNYAFANTAASKNVAYEIRFTELGFNTLLTASNTYLGSPITVNGAMTAAPNGPGVSGVVTDAVTHQLLQGVPVRLWLADSIGRYLATATNASGQYSFVGIPAGTYQIQFAAAGYTVYWYLNATSRGTATIFTIGGSQQTINAAQTGLCKLNPSGIDVLFTSHGLPITLTTGGVLLLVVASSVLLFDSKRKVALAHRVQVESASGSGGKAGR